MITGLQNTFGKHHKVLLGALLAVTIVSFVFFGSWSTGAGNRDRASIYLGVNLADKHKNRQYYDYASLASQNGGNFLQLLQHAVLMLKIADAAEIPAPSKTQFEKMLRDSFGTGEEFSKKLSEFRNAAKQIFADIDGAPVSDAAAGERLENYLNNTWRIRQASRLLAGAGYALPAEAALVRKIQTTRRTVESATFPFELFNPAITPSDTDLQNFFEPRKEDYKLPPRIALAYAIKKSGTPAKTAAEIEALGIKTAGELSQLLDDELPIEENTAPAKTAEQTANFLKKHKLVAIDVPEFDQNDIPTTLPVPANILRSGFDLTETNPRSDARILGTDAVVLFLKKRTPERIPELSEVRAKVAADFAKQEKLRLYNARSAELAGKLRDAVAAGKKFEDAAKSLELLVKKYPEFQQADTPAELAPAGQTLFNALNATPAGQVAPQVRIGGNTVYVYVVKKDEPLIDPASAEVREIIPALGMEASFLNIYGDPRSGQPGIITGEL